MRGGGYEKRIYFLTQLRGAARSRFPGLRSNRPISGCLKKRKEGDEPSKSRFLKRPKPETNFDRRRLRAGPDRGGAKKTQGNNGVQPCVRVKEDRISDKSFGSRKKQVHSKGVTFETREEDMVKRNGVSRKREVSIPRSQDSDLAAMRKGNCGSPLMGP